MKEVLIADFRERETRTFREEDADFVVKWGLFVPLCPYFSFDELLKSTAQEKLTGEKSDDSDSSDEYDEEIIKRVLHKTIYPFFFPGPMETIL